MSQALRTQASPPRGTQADGSPWPCGSGGRHKKGVVISLLICFKNICQDFGFFAVPVYTRTLFCRFDFR